MDRKIKMGLLVLAAIVAGLLLPELGLAGLLLVVGQVDMTTGVRSTLDLSPQRLKLDMDDISLLDPNKTPYIALLTRIGRKSCHNPQFWHMERQLLPRWDSVVAVGGLDNNEVEVDNVDYFSVGDLVKVPATGEVMFVISIAGSILTVARGAGTTAAGALAADAPLQIIGNANEEGTGMRTLKATVSEEIRNFTQIFRNPFGVTNTQNASDMYGAQDINALRHEIGMSHAIDIERAFWFGELALRTGADGNPIRFTRGILSYLMSGTSACRFMDVSAAGGTLTEAAFREWLRCVYTHDPSQPRVIFMSRLVADVIDGWAGEKLKMVPRDQTYGIHITRYISAVGEVYLVQHHLFTGATYGGMAVAVPMKECAYRYLQGRDTKLKTNIQNNDADGIIDEYLSEVGLQLKHPEKFGILSGVETGEAEEATT